MEEEVEAVVDPEIGLEVVVVTVEIVLGAEIWKCVNNQLKNAGIRPKRLPSKSYVVACATNINPYSSLVKAYVSTKIGHSLSPHSGPSGKTNIASMGKRKNDDIQFDYCSSTWPPTMASQGDARILIEVAY